MKNLIINGLKKTSVFMGLVYAVVPEKFFEKIEYISNNMFSISDTKMLNVIISRGICFFIIGTLYIICLYFYRHFRKKIIIRGQNYLIQVEYGDILKTQNCKRIINFDECFTTKVGDGIADINSNSICGQYLLLNPNFNISKLIRDNKIKPDEKKSKYKNKIRYASGTIVPNGDDLLMAFAKLDEKGKGRFFSRDEYLECLDLLWKEIENYYSEKDVCVPILGSGTTSFDGSAGASISKQDLLNMMIWSYRLSSHKIKAPHKLRIICKRNDGFSINNIDS